MTAAAPRWKENQRELQSPDDKDAHLMSERHLPDPEQQSPEPRQRRSAEAPVNPSKVLLLHPSSSRDLMGPMGVAESLDGPGGARSSLHTESCICCEVLFYGR